MACARVLRLAESPEDIRRIMRLALFAFFSVFSSLVDDDDETAVCGGDRFCAGSRLCIDIRPLLIDIALPCAGEVCTEGGRDDDLTAVGDNAPDWEVIDRRRSEKDALVSLIISLIMVTEDLLSFAVALEDVDRRRSFESTLR